MKRTKLLLTAPQSSEIRVMVSGDFWNDNDWEMRVFKVKPGNYVVDVIDNCISVKKTGEK